MNQVILFLLILNLTYNIDEKITDDDGDEVDNPKYAANKVGKNATEVVIPLPLSFGEV